MFQTLKTVSRERERERTSRLSSGYPASITVARQVSKGAHFVWNHFIREIRNSKTEIFYGQLCFWLSFTTSSWQLLFKFSS